MGEVWFIAGIGLISALINLAQVYRLLAPRLNPLEWIIARATTSVSGVAVAQMRRGTVRARVEQRDAIDFDVKRIVLKAQLRGRRIRSPLGQSGGGQRGMRGDCAVSTGLNRTNRRSAQSSIRSCAIVG